MSSKYDTDDYKLTFSLTWTRVTPKENCSSCNGTGLMTDHFYPTNSTSCYTCSGTGKLYSNEKNLSPEIPQALIDDLAAAWKKHNSPLTFCNDCNGTGEYGPYMCERCDGTGEHEPYEDNVCFDCHGTGEVEDPATRFETMTRCVTCDGTGE